MSRVVRLLPAAADRVAVVLDDDRRLAVEASTIYELDLTPGRQISDQTLAELERQDAVSRAMQKALRLLAVRPRSGLEMSRALKPYGPDAVEESISRLISAGLLDDGEFASRWVEERARTKGFGRRRLSQELAQRGIRGEAAEAALAAVGDESSAAEEFVRRKLERTIGDRDDAVLQRRLMSQLMRRGFDAAIARKAIETVKGSMPDAE